MQVEGESEYDVEPFLAPTPLRHTAHAMFISPPQQSNSRASVRAMDLQAKLTAALQLVNVTTECNAMVHKKDAEMRGQMRELTASANRRCVDVEKSRQIRSEAEEVLRLANADATTMR